MEVEYVAEFFVCPFPCSTFMLVGMEKPLNEEEYVELLSQTNCQQPEYD